MSEKWKNVVGILIIVAVVAAIVAGVTMATLDNRSTKEVEYFIDDAPSDYSAPENVVYVRLFRDTVENLFSSVYDDWKLTDFADRLLRAASKARIPAYKLEGMARAIRQANLNEWWEDFQVKSTEQIRAQLGQTTSEVFRNAVCELFDLSGLTTREFALFLYRYLELYGAPEYQTALAVVGQDSFVDFVGSTCFVLQQTRSFGQGNETNASSILAASYEYGEIIKRACSFGMDSFCLVFGLNPDHLDEQLIAQMPYITEKTGYLFCLMGYLFSEMSAETAKSFADKFDGSDDYVTMAKDVMRGAESFIRDYGESFGAADYDELAAIFVVYVEEMYRGEFVSLSVDVTDEVFKEYLSTARKETAAGLDAIRSLATAEPTDEQRELWISDVKKLGAWLNEYAESYIYFWVIQRFGELGEEVE